MLLPPVLRMCCLAHAFSGCAGRTYIHSCLFFFLYACARVRICALAPLRSPVGVGTLPPFLDSPVRNRQPTPFSPQPPHLCVYSPGFCPLLLDAAQRCLLGSEGRTLNGLRTRSRGCRRCEADSTFRPLWWRVDVDFGAMEW